MQSVNTFSDLTSYLSTKFVGYYIPSILFGISDVFSQRYLLLPLDKHILTLYSPIRLVAK